MTCEIIDLTKFLAAKRALELAPPESGAASFAGFEHLNGVHPTIIKKLSDLALDLWLEYPDRGEFGTGFLEVGTALKGYLTVLLKCNRPGASCVEEKFTVWALLDGSFVMSLTDDPDADICADVCFIPEKPYCNISRQFLATLELRVREFFANAELDEVDGMIFTADEYH